MIEKTWVAILSKNGVMVDVQSFTSFGAAKSYVRSTEDKKLYIIKEQRVMKFADVKMLKALIMKTA